MKNFFRETRTRLSLLFLTIIVVAAVFAPVLAPHDPLEMNTLHALEGPSRTHPLGTDEYGRDLLSRLIYGARPSLLIAIGSVALATVLGVPVGITAAYFQGMVGQVIMRLVDVALCFPPILIAMVIVGLLGPSELTLVVVIGFLYASRFARQAYAAALEVSQVEYVEAARALGASNARVMLRTILPNIMAPVFVLMSLSLAGAILLESGLSFLGLGVTPPTPSWGQMIGTARRYMLRSVGYVLFPSLTVATAILAFNTLGDALRDFLDPKLRSE